MTRWVVFAGITLFIFVGLLALARLSATAVDGPHLTPAERRWLDGLPDGTDHLEAKTKRPSPPRRRFPVERTLSPGSELSPMALLANVAVSHALFGSLLVGGIWLADVPPSALGVGSGSLSLPAVAIGVALGVGLSVANTLAAGIATAFGADPSEEIRELLTPESAAGWVVLLVFVLPIIAGFEELLFRGALVGAFAVGFDLSPWLLAVFSSVGFAAGHGVQGGLGIVVTGLLGFALAAAFVLTNSLVVVVVAHYVVNAVEFFVFEGLGYEPF